ncbi:MAG: 2-dehydro-3-deoxyphosphooctonate aldolase (KDO 8-P synthase) [Rhodothermales bacterium]|jgi:2-dehydro-3-deoxyphosphooctonate aldolase (KDO 8-P synthase)
MNVTLNDAQIGLGNPLLVIAGPCVIESESLCREIATEMKAICARLGLPYVFKASYDKANRTSVSGFRGPGITRGLEILGSIGSDLGLPVTSDVHDATQIPLAGEVLDILQIPAFLCRQTDLLVAAGETGRVVNIKKGQFLAPSAMGPAVEKVRSTGNERVMLTERGSTFGYGNLVVDMRALPQMRAYGTPVIFDATHSVQQPGGLGDATGGDREMAPVLLRGAAAVGIDGVFLEVHPDPDNAKSDGPNTIPLDRAEAILRKARDIHALSV